MSITVDELRTDIIARYERDAHGRNKAVQQAKLSASQVEWLRDNVHGFAGHMDAAKRAKEGAA